MVITGFMILWFMVLSVSPDCSETILFSIVAPECLRGIFLSSYFLVRMTIFDDSPCPVFSQEQRPMLVRISDNFCFRTKQV